MNYALAGIALPLSSHGCFILIIEAPAQMSPPQEAVPQNPHLN